MAWVTPKTDWALNLPDGARQYFNVLDYARITGNLQEIWNYAESIRYELKPLAAMIPLDYSGIPSACVFNAVERNVEALASATYMPPDYTAGRVFAGDGSDRTWTYDDLNRIENLSEEIHSGLISANAAAPVLAQSDFFCGNLYL